jgi:hypothetical protein
MSIVGAFDVHRRQLTFEYLAMVSGELKRGRVVPADRERLRAWLARLAGQQDVHFAVEGCTGWRYVTEDLAAAGITPHLAEPADTAALRGRKRHAKPTRPTPGICGCTCWPGTCPGAGSRRSTCWRPGPPCGCLRTWSIRAGITDNLRTLTALIDTPAQRAESAFGPAGPCGWRAEEARGAGCRPHPRASATSMITLPGAGRAR